MINAAAEARGQRRGDGAGPGVVGGVGWGFAEGDQADAFGDAAAADQTRLDNGVDAKLGLHPLDYAARAVGGCALGPQLARDVRLGEFERLQDQRGDRASAAGGQPAVELPAHAICRGVLGERFARAPDALHASAV